MITSTIARRYARAFFAIAAEQKRYEAYFAELDRFSALLKENRNLREYLANPVFDRTDKKAVLDAVLGRVAVSPLSANFFRLLVDKRRIGILSDIVGAYRELMDNALNKARVTVTTAFPLTGELSGRLRQRLAELTGREVELSVREDRALLGGIIVRVGDTLYDGSIRAELNNMRNLLGEGN